MKNFLITFTLIAAFAIVSCDKEKSDFEKGKEDGKAVCDCIKALDISTTEGALQALTCMNKLDLTKIDMDEDDPSKWSDYQKGIQSVECDVDFGAWGE